MTDLLGMGDGFCAAGALVLAGWPVLIAGLLLGVVPTLLSAPKWATLVGKVVGIGQDRRNCVLLKCNHYFVLAISNRRNGPQPVGLCYSHCAGLRWVCAGRRFAKVWLVGICDNFGISG